jgi:hypothetical protein
MRANVLFFCVTTWGWNDLSIILHVSRDTIHHVSLIKGKEGKIAENFCFLYFIKKQRLMVTTSNDSIVEDV